MIRVGIYISNRAKRVSVSTSVFCILSACRSVNAKRIGRFTLFLKLVFFKIMRNDVYKRLSVSFPFQYGGQLSDEKAQLWSNAMHDCYDIRHECSLYLCETMYVLGVIRFLSV